MSLSRMIRKAPPRSTSIFREQIIGLAADECLQRDVACHSPGNADEARQAAGSISSSRTLRAAFLELEDQRQAAVGDEREGVRGVDRLRGEQREDLLAEMLVEPGLGFGVERLVADDDACRPRRASSGARAQTSCWLVTSRSASTVIAASCCADGQSVGRAFLNAERLVRLEAGHPDHEEFVEVAGRDRQEAQPLEQRVARGWTPPRARGG